MKKYEINMKTKKIKQNMKWWNRLILLLMSMSIAFSFPFSVCAQVDSTSEQTAGTAIYVAGNPDMYPIEYYNEETESYVGILPELYDQISEKYGMDICYVSSGMKNSQKRLASNCQVEIVSAHYAGDIRNLREEYTFVSFEKDGEWHRICIGFTDIASDELTGIIKKELMAVDDRKLLSDLLAETERNRNGRLPILWVIVVSVLAVICLIFFAVFLRMRSRERKKEETAQIDTMTGIGNSVYFKWAYDNCISPQSASLYYIAYIAIQIEQLCTYFGEKKAEEIQIYAADVLSSGIEDTGFVARIKNGAFALAFQAITKEAALQRVTAFLDTLNSYEDNFVQEYHVPFQAGLYGLSVANVSCETAIYNARQGYHAAVENKQQIGYSDKAFLGKEEVRMKLQRKLTDAINNNHFSMMLQFIVKPENGRICGAEALSRWIDPEEGQLSPDRYIESMINAGMIDRLDFYIFEQVCRQLEQWNKTPYQDMFVSCNFSRPTVESETFLQRIREIVGRYTFKRSNLILELTEDALADNQALVFENMNACKKMGFRIALDDFGSGYTSFRDLAEYPVDVIKIDRFIIMKSVTEKGNALLTGIVRLAHDLGIEVLCEGVETEEQNEIIKATGCEYIQGYYYSRVFPVEHAMGFYERYMGDKGTGSVTHY